MVNDQTEMPLTNVKYQIRRVLITCKLSPDISTLNLTSNTVVITVQSVYVIIVLVELKLLLFVPYGDG